MPAFHGIHCYFYNAHVKSPKTFTNKKQKQQTFNAEADFVGICRSTLAQTLHRK